MSSSEESSTTDNAENLTWIETLFVAKGIDPEAISGAIMVEDIIKLLSQEMTGEYSLRMKTDSEDIDRLEAMTVSDIYIRIPINQG